MATSTYLMVTFTSYHGRASGHAPATLPTLCAHSFIFFTIPLLSLIIFFLSVITTAFAEVDRGANIMELSAAV